MNATTFYREWKISKAFKVLSESKNTQQKASAIDSIAELWAKRGQ